MVEGEKMYIVHCDGGMRNLFNCITLGVHIYDTTSGEVKEINKIIIEESNSNNLDNNIAEFKAIIVALEELKKMGVSNKRIVIKNDDKTVVKMLAHRQYNKNKNLRKMCAKVRKKLYDFSNLKIKWIPRANNSVAHSLSEQAYREYKKKIYIKRCIINPRENGVYMVLSSKGETFYEVNLDKLTCNCNYFLYTPKKHICKHIQAVQKKYNT